MKAIYSLFWLLSFATAAHAADSEFLDVPLEELMDVNVTSITKMALPLKKSPVTTLVILKDEINNKGYRFLTDILKNTPGIHIANLTNTEASATEIYVRGVLANNKITVLIDGIKIKSPTGEPITFLNTIPLINVNQVEISFGSASSVYGADAMLATINLVTDNGAGIDGLTIKATGGSQDTGEVQVAAGTKISEDINVSLTGSFHRSGQEDLKQNYPEMFGNLNSVDLTEQNHNVHFKANYKDLTVSYYRLFTQNNSSIGFTPDAPSSYDYSGAAFFKNLNQIANATYSWDLDQFWQAKSSLSYERNEVLPDSSYIDYGIEKPDHKARLSEAIRFSQNVIYQRDNISWLSGTELTFLNATPKYNVDNPSFNKVHVEYQNYAVFSQLNYDVNDDLALNASLRMDSDSRYSPEFNPRLGFSWQALQPLRFFGAWGTSYLAPSTFYIYEKWGEPTWSSYHRPNINLLPERIHTYELGTDFTPMKNSLFKLLGFYTTATDLIRVVNNSGTGLANYNGNVASLTTYGLQLIANQHFDNGLDLNADYTLTKGTQDAEKLSNGKVGLTNMPEQMIKGNILYSLDKFTLRFTGRWFDNIVTHESNALYHGGVANGALVFDSNLHYSLPFKTAKWSIDLGVNDLFDQKYYTIHSIDNFSDSLPRLPQETRRLYFTVGFSY